MAAHKITFTASGWTQAYSALYYDDETRLIYVNSSLDMVVDKVEPSVRECYRFNGYYAANSAAAPGVQYVTAAGEFTQELWDKLASLTGTTGVNIYVDGTQVSYKITINDSSGDGGDGIVFYKKDGGGFYPDYLCEEEQLLSLTIPTRIGCTFKGYYASTSTSAAQYTDKAGVILEAFTTTANKTIYAQWQALFKITISANGGTGGDAAFYCDSLNGKYYLTNDVTTEAVTAITPHTRTLYRFIGIYKANNTTSDIVVNADGTIAEGYAPTAAATIYCQWEQVSWTLTLNDYGGSDGAGVLYYKIDGGGFYVDYLCSGDAVECVTLPTRVGYACKGYFNGTTTPGLQYFDHQGKATLNLVALELTASKAIYAAWQAPYKITISANSGTGGTTAFYYDAVNGRFHLSNDVTTEVVTAVAPHTRECFSFLGAYATNATTGEAHVLSSGEIASAFAPTKATTIYCQWERASWKLTLSNSGGEGGAEAIYSKIDGGTLHADDLCVDAPITAIPMPSLLHHVTLGYFNAESGSVQYVEMDGALRNELTTLPITENRTLYCRYLAFKKVTLDRNHGDAVAPEDIPVIYYDETSGVWRDEHDAQTDFVNKPFRSLYIFTGYFTDRTGGVERVNGDGEFLPDFTPTANMALYAQWVESGQRFGVVEDFFNISSNSLVPISSDSGDNRQRVCVSHLGKHTPGVSETSGVWRNPTVTYSVVKDCTVRVTLGKAFAATKSDSTMTISGYMITGVTVETGAGRFPAVTVTGAANEGADAINKFKVEVPVKARSRAQNLLGAVSGGGHLQALTLAAQCDPVVIAEKMMPCASDVVNGRMTVNASTLAPGLESAPTAANGFTATGEPKSESHAAYRAWSITARKEMT